MATLLYRLGQFAYRRAWYVIAAWLVVLIAVVGAIAVGGPKFSNSFEIPGTQSQEALDRLSAVFPQTGNASISVVYSAEDGGDIAAHKADIKQLAEELRAIEHVDTVQQPWNRYAFATRSDDGALAISTVVFDSVTADVPTTAVDAVLATAEHAARLGLRAEFSGQILQTPSFTLSIVELFGVLVAAVVLIISFGSLLAAGMPLLTALVGAGISVGGIAAASSVMEISSTAPLLALMIGLAVGIDYSFFILMRHRTQLAQGVEPAESAARAVGTAGSAVIFAGLTVIVALLGLLIVGIPFLSTMGVSAALAVLVAMALAVTLVPALLGVAKGRLTPKPASRAARRASDPDARSMGRRWVTGVMRAPWAVIAGVALLLGVIAIPAASLQLALPDASTYEEGSTVRQSFEQVEQHFGPGYNAPLVIAADITQTTELRHDLKAVRDDLRAVEGVVEVSRGLPNPTIDTAVFRVIPEASGAAPETQAVVAAIRDLGPEIQRDYDISIAVTGSTAVQIDISTRLGDALIPFGMIVVGLSIVLLMVVFRSVWVPVKAALGFLLSVLAAFGVVVAVFQWGWGAELIGVTPGPVLSFMPIILMGVLFGLAMDYEVFLVSGMRESWVHGGDAKKAIVDGFSHAARVVTGAALIMLFIFSAFVPEGTTEIKPIALALAAGVLFDAFVVRMTLVPAVMTVLGRHAWWLPGWLGRLLPNVDIEGEQLQQHREGVAWAKSRPGAIVAENVELDAVAGTRPFSVFVPNGGAAIVTGPRAARRVFAATVAGRLAPAGGRMHVAGLPLPSDAAAVSRRVAIAELEAPVPPGSTVAEFVRDAAGDGRARRLANSRAGAALQSLQRIAGVHPDERVDELSTRSRLLAVAAAAAAQGTPVLVVQLPEAVTKRPVSGNPIEDADGADLIEAILGLVPHSTTVVITASDPVVLDPGLERSLQWLPLPTDDPTYPAAQPEPDAQQLTEGAPA